MGVDDYEPRVLHQLLEYMQGYAVDVFADAAQFAEHAGRSGQLECEDVQLSARLKAASAQAHPPQLLERMARARNQHRLLALKDAQIRLPKPGTAELMVEENWQLEVPNRPRVAAGSAAAALTAQDKAVAPPRAPSEGPVSFSLPRAPHPPSKGGGPAPMQIS